MLWRGTGGHASAASSIFSPLNKYGQRALTHFYHSHASPHLYALHTPALDSTKHLLSRKGHATLRNGRLISCANNLRHLFILHRTLAYGLVSPFPTTSRLRLLLVGAASLRARCLRQHSWKSQTLNIYVCGDAFVKNTARAHRTAHALRHHTWHACPPVLYLHWRRNTPTS